MPCARALSRSHMLDNDPHYHCRSLKYLKSPWLLLPLNPRESASASSAQQISPRAQKRPTVKNGVLATDPLQMSVLECLCWRSLGMWGFLGRPWACRDCSCTVKSCALGWHGQSTGWRLYYEHTRALFGWTTGCECTVEENNNATYFLNN